MTAVNRHSFLCPLSMATGYLSVLLQSLGGAAHGFWCSYNRQGRSDWLRAQPEVVQTHGLRICFFKNLRLLLTCSPKWYLARRKEGTRSPKWYLARRKEVTCSPKWYLARRKEATCSPKWYLDRRKEATCSPKWYLARRKEATCSP